jgi:hypothetical protein
MMAAMAVIADAMQMLSKQIINQKRR